MNQPSDTRVEWVMVPKVRTEAMHQAAQSTTGAVLTHLHSAEIWGAMLASSPQPSAPEGEIELVQKLHELEVVASAERVSGRYRINLTEAELRTWAQDAVKIIRVLPVRPSEASTLLRSQADTIARMEEANRALMAERTSLIETKWGQIERLTAEVDRAKTMFEDCVEQHNAQMTRAEAAESRLSQAGEKLRELATSRSEGVSLGVREHLRTFLKDQTP